MPTAMTSKERVRAAIARQPVDRVPLGFYCADHDTVSRVIGRPTYVRNKIAQQLALWDGRWDEVAESLMTDTVEFYRKLDCVDLILPKEAPVLPPREAPVDPPKQIAENRWEDRHSRVYQAVWEVNEIQCVYAPPTPPRTYTIEEFAAPMPVAEPDPSCFRALDHVIAELGQDRFVCTVTGGVTALTTLGGTEQGLMLYALQPEIVQAANRRSVDFQNRRDAWFIRPGADAAFMEQDMAGSNGPLISPRQFETCCYPFLKERVQHVKQRCDQVIFHNCGNNLPLMELFIDCGIDCYQSLQTTAGMDVAMLQATYGDQLAFWGGMPVEILVAGTMDETRQAVRTMLCREAAAQGFIFGPSHSVAYGTRYDNFMAMLDEFTRLRDRV